MARNRSSIWCATCSRCSTRALRWTKSCTPRRYRLTIWRSPNLRAKYDDPEFLVRAIYHFYAGWFDGNAAHLKPARTAELATELALLAGGADKLAERALERAAQGQARLAVELAELAGAARPDAPRIQESRAKVLHALIGTESSLMGKAFLAVYEREAARRAEQA